MPARPEVDPGRRVPAAAVGRLPRYLRALDDLAAVGADTVSSHELAEASGVTSSQVRKDLACLGSRGTRGVGYELVLLRAEIDAALGLAHGRGLVVVGIGNLGHALAGYPGFSDRGFELRALFDHDPEVVGTTVAGLVVQDVDDAAEALAGLDVTVGVIATPASAAQHVCDRLVAAGVVSILTLAPAVLAVPPHVHVRSVDLAAELQILGYHQARSVRRAEPALEVAR